MQIFLTTRWLGIAAGMTIATIVVHELGHYLGAVFMGGTNVHLHWADVTYETASLSGMGEAIMALAGPLITHAIILGVWINGATNIAALAIGFGACSRNFLLFPYSLKSLLGRDVSGFFNDEVQAGMAIDVNPLFFAGIAVFLGLGGAVVFLKRSARAHGLVAPAALFIGTIGGIAFWSHIGPMLMSGGRGIG